MQINWNPEKRKLVDLKHWEKNPRKISEQKFEELKEKIKARGFHDVIKIDQDNIILSGNMRKEALEQLGISEVNVLVPDRKLTTEEMVLVGIESNILAGEWDTDALKEFGTDTLLQSGLGDEELSSLFDNVETTNDEFDENKAIDEATQKTTVKDGDIYELGDHRLMCGDSLNEEDVKKLMGDKKINMIYCDPPYNIGLDYSKGISTAGKYDSAMIKAESNTHFRGGKNDDKSLADYKNFLEKIIENSIKHAEKDFHIFYWCDEKYIWLLQTIYAGMGIMNKRVCMWIKNNFNMTPQIAFNKVYEPCVYGTVGRPYLNPSIKNLNEVLNKEGGTGNQVHDEIFDLFNIWLIKRDNAQDYDHPTQKPVILHEKTIKRCTRPGEIIIDLFGGSGSTLMACEQLKRQARLMEISPIFAQVIINRYEAYTGNKAIKI
jgi:site-specific DNA-methyltransferase (adenine-specific)